MRSLIGIIVMLCIIAISCTKKNEEELMDQHPQVLCDTSDVKYSSDVLPIFQKNCYSCHGNGATEGGVSLGNYSKVITQANDALMDVITHTPGFSPMPEGQPKLSDCDINKIRAWINQGALNN